jgi:hypothetical protein
MSVLDTPNINNPATDGDWRPPHRLWLEWFLLVARHLRALGLPPEHADNAAALAAGLTVGDHYRTGDALKVVH